MHKHKIISLILVLVLIITVIRCRRLERQPERDESQEGKTEEKPEEKQEKERDFSQLIPEQIRKGDGEEPNIKVYLVDQKKIQEMKFEEYVMGVLAGEMENDWPEEALMAQAVLARTFVLKFIADKGGSKHEGEHVSTD
ncbi:MAG: SpoIID/LytB domain-containing protein [Clostridiales bacterium]|nr:SpoIID/LytB domain-containing protein [Clostridiales bacterium]